MQKDEALAKLVPSDVASDGKIVVGSDASYAPNEFVDTDGTTIIGMDVDLGKAIGQKLGLEVEFQNSAFDGILPGIAAKKYELGMSSFTDNAEREKVVDMVTLLLRGHEVGRDEGQPGRAQDRRPVRQDGRRADGHRPGRRPHRAQRRTAPTAGKPAINVSQFQAQTDVTLALTASGEAMLADSPVVDYAVTKTNGQLEAVGDAYDTAPYGIAVPKGQTATTPRRSRAPCRP